MTDPDTHAATDQAALLTGAVQSLEVNAPPKPKIANFPLPRELRDEIYGYLVDAKRIQYTDQTKSPPIPTYKFHLSITGVNKAIHREALEYLDSKTGLVMVHLTGYGLFTTLQNFRVPHIFMPNSTFDKCSHDIIANTPTMVLVQWERSPLDLLLSKLEPQRPDHSGHYDCVLVMVQQDVPALFDVLQFMCQWTYPDAIYITSEKGDPVKLRSDDANQAQDRAGPPSVTVACSGSRKGNRVGQQAQRRILESIRGATGCSYKIRLGNFDDKELVREALDVARPKIIWLAAQSWDTLDAVLNMQRRADVHAVDDVADVVWLQYAILLDYIVNDASIWTDSGSIKGAPSLEHWQSVVFDLTMSCAWLATRHGNRDAANEGVVAGVQHLDPTGILNDDIAQGKFLHLILFSRCDNFLGQVMSADEIFGLRNLLSALEGTTSKDDYIMHDLPIFQDALVQLPPPGNDAQEAFNFDHTQLSCYTMPVITFNSIGARSAPLPTRPARFENWQDKEHLAALSKEDKKKIQDKQAELGFRVSEF